MSLISVGRKNLKLFKHAETCLSFSSEGVVPPCLKRGKHSTSVCVSMCVMGRGGQCISVWMCVGVCVHAFARTQVACMHVRSDMCALALIFQK